MKDRPKRKALSAKTRFDVFKRDSFVCQYCGAHPPKVVLHVDHIIPVVEGGDNDPDNLVTSCDRCNLGKGPRPLTDVPKSLAEKSEEIAERERQILGYSEVLSAKRERIEEQSWQIVYAFSGEESIRRDWFQSIKKFVDQLGFDETLEAMEIAVSSPASTEYQRFKYFCGVCWRKIKDDQ